MTEPQVRSKNEAADMLRTALYDIHFEYMEWSAGNTESHETIAKMDVKADGAIMALDAALAWERRRTVDAAVRYANHGRAPLPNAPCGSCVLAADEVSAILTESETSDE